MKDEEYLFISDVIDKKVTARSARNARTHNGKGGRVKLPSDYLSKKEIKAMSGECKSWRLNAPMTWEEFKGMPEDIQISYIKALRAKYNAPISAMAKMMDVDRGCLSKHLSGLGFEKQTTTRRKLDKMGFMEWCYGMPKQEEEPAEETVAEEVEQVPEGREETPVQEEAPAFVPFVDEKQLKKIALPQKAIPTTGTMTFEGDAEDVLKSINALLGGAKVLLSVKWDVLEE